jgi:Skp family chaperone for outer membrane proteins
MMRPAACRVGLLGVLLLGHVAAAPTAADPEAALGGERDRLIAKIAAGEDLQASVLLFQKLLLRRKELIAAQQAEAERIERQAAAEQAAAEAQKRAQQAEQQRRQEAEAAEAQKRAQLEARQQAYLQSLDQLAGRYCYLSAFPRERHHKGGVTADFGKVVRKIEVRIPPKNALADETPVTLY